jgi:hypothetical protein
MMSFGKHDGICLEEEIYASVQELRCKLRAMTTVRSQMVSYAHIDRDCNHHGFLKQNFEWLGKDIFGAFEERASELVNFHRRRVTLVSSLLAFPLGEFDENNRPKSAVSMSWAP